MTAHMYDGYKFMLQGTSLWWWVQVSDASRVQVSDTGYKLGTSLGYKLSQDMITWGSYMIDHIWSVIYSKPYMDNHIWLTYTRFGDIIPVHDCDFRIWLPYMIIRIWWFVYDCESYMVQHIWFNIYSFMYMIIYTNHIWVTIYCFSYIIIYVNHIWFPYMTVIYDYPS